MTSYSLQHAARILRVNPSRLRYWKRTELIPPAPDGESGAELRVEPRQGSLDFKGLIGVRSILALIEAGVSLRRIRRSLDEVRERYPDLEDPVAAIRLWAEGSDRLVIRPEGLLEEPSGQILFDLEVPAPTPSDDDAVASIVGVAMQPAEPDDARLARTVIEWFERGCSLDAESSTYQEAIDAYETALSLDDNFADAHCNLGAVHYNRGDRDGARQCFRRCLQLDAEHVEGHFNLANLLEEDGADEMALQHYVAALRADPMYPDLHINLALLHEKLGHTTRALEHWRRYLQLDANGSWSDVARQRLSDTPAGA